ncbi:hypothetical protein C0995_010522, partial [Termitomyces sp. Mi166
MKELLAKATTPPATLSAAPSSLIPASAATVPQAGGEFVPLISGIGINGMSSSTAPLSLHTHFPNVNMAVITAIITHEFKAADLHKLNLTNCL